MKKISKKRMADFKKYVATYDLSKQASGEPNTVLKDMIYGVGILVGGDKNKWHEGFLKFKRELYDILRAEFQS